MKPARVLLLALLACHPAEPKGDSPRVTQDSATVDEPSILTSTTETAIPDTGTPPVAARNLLLLTMDTTRADRINSNGYPLAETSPRIDALLASGLALRAHRSCSSWTFASFLCLLTGRDQVDLGYWPDNDKGGVDPYPSDDLPSLARLLSDQGFGTGLVYANSFLSAKFHMNQGHDSEQFAGRAARVAEHAVAQMDILAGEHERWFLHAHFNDAHGPYAPPKAFRSEGTSCPGFDADDRDGFNDLQRAWTGLDDATQSACQDHLRMLYDGSIRYADHHLGAIVDHLEERGERDETLIVFATDHGEAFYEHGDWEHGFGLQDTLTRSTAGLVYAPRVPPEEHTDATAHEDLLPTILDLLDLPVPPTVTGTPIDTVPRAPAHQLVYRNDLTVQSVVTATDKLIFHWVDGRRQYFDLSVDPDEQDDRYDADDPRVAALWDLLEPAIDALALATTDGAAPQGL